MKKSLYSTISTVVHPSMDDTLMILGFRENSNLSDKNIRGECIGTISYNAGSRSSQFGLYEIAGELSKDQLWDIMEDWYAFLRHSGK